MKAMTVWKYRNATNCLHQLLKYISEECSTIFMWWVTKKSSLDQSVFRIGWKQLTGFMSILNHLVTIKTKATFHQNCSFQFNEAYGRAIYIHSTLIFQAIENRLMCCYQNLKVPGSNPIKGSARLTDPTSLRGFLWHSSQICKNAVIKIRWVWLLSE